MTSAYPLMALYISVKFYENMTKITSFNIQKDIIPTLSKPVLSFLSSARRLIVLLISLKVS